MQHILTGCYVAKPKGHSHISKHCGARMRNETAFGTFGKTLRHSPEAAMR